MLHLTENNMVRSENHPTCIRLLLADNQPRVRRSLEVLLKALSWSKPNPIVIPFEIVGEAGNGQEVLDQVECLHPHVVIIDIPIHHAAYQISISEFPMDGLATIQTIKQRWPAVWIVVLTMFATERAAIMQAGADVFLLKGCPTGELLDAVMCAAY